MHGNSRKSQSSCYKYFHFLPFVPFSSYVSIIIIDLTLSCESMRLSLIETQCDEQSSPLTACSCSLLPPCCLPTACSLLPAPCSLVPAPCSLLPAPCSLLP